jgi:hypothetical protein
LANIVMAFWRTAAGWNGAAVLRIANMVRAARARRRARFDDREARGMTLLREWLSPQQLWQLEAYNHFEVIGCDSGTRYRIKHGVSTNVVELDGNGRALVGWCFIPQGNLVAGDVMLAQKIALETDERRALAIAKQFLVPPRPPTFLAPP